MLWDIKKVLGSQKMLWDLKTSFGISKSVLRSQKMIDIVGIIEIVDIVNSFIIVNIADTC